MSDAPSLTLREPNGVLISTSSFFPLPLSWVVMEQPTSARRQRMVAAERSTNRLRMNSPGIGSPYLIVRLRESKSSLIIEGRSAGKQRGCQGQRQYQTIGS